MKWMQSLLKITADRGKLDSGRALYTRQMVTGAYVAKRDREVFFYGSVHDDYHRQTYSCMLRVDQVGQRILESSCDCQSILGTHMGPQLCSHVVAIAYKGMEIEETQGELDHKEVVISPSIFVSIGALKRGTFSMQFEIEGIEKSSYRKIFTAFKEGKKRFYLGEGQYLNLEESKLNHALTLIDLLGVYNEIEQIKIPEQKALFLEEQLQDMDFVEGREKVTNSLKKLVKIAVNEVLPNAFEMVLRPYQKEGFYFLTTAAKYGLGGILADEMGLGKTIQMIAFLVAQEQTKRLIITPTALIYNWQREFQRFAPNVRVGIIHGSKENRRQVLAKHKQYDILLTTYTTYRNDVLYYQEIEWDYCVLDEAQQIKNPASQTTVAMKGITAKVRFALTGTPIENHLMELWSLMDFVMPGYLYNALRFQKIFMTDPPQVESLKRLVAPFMLHRKKSEVLEELPDKIETSVLLTLDGYHQRAYRGMRQMIKQKVQLEETGRMTLLAYLTKLRQLCLVPELMVKEYKGENAKLEYCIQFLKENTHQKVLIFSQFTRVLGEIRTRLEEEGIKYSYLDGQTSAKERVERVESFNHTPEQKVFLISLKAGGTGLNLTSASTVIHFDPWWNPAVEAQASDRAHRMGQKHVVNVLKLVAKGTIEEHVIALQAQKKELIEQVMDEGHTPTLVRLSEKELMDLLIEG